MNGDISLISLFRWLWQRKGVIFITQVIAITATIIFSSSRFIQPEYKSSATVYPANLGPYPMEVCVQQLLEYLNSVDVKNAVIRKCSLITHYKIDTTKKYWYSSLLGRYNGNVRIDVTGYNGIIISAYDVNPDTACLMANTIIKEVNSTILADQRQLAHEFMVMDKRQMDNEKKEIDSLSALAKIMSVQYGLLDYAGQTKELEKAYYQMLATSKSGKPFEEASTQIKNLEEKGEQFKEVNQHLTSTLTAYDDISLKYKEAIRDANKQISFMSMVSKPYPDDRKAYPTRWELVVLASLSVLFVSMLVLRFLEKFKQL